RLALPPGSAEPRFTRRSRTAISSPRNTAARLSFALMTCEAGSGGFRRSPRLIRTTRSARRRSMKSLANDKGQSTMAAGHKPGSLLAQWKLVEAAVRDRHLSRGDIAGLFRVVDSFYQFYGTSRAAHSYLATGTRLSRRAVISSTKRPRALGYMEVARIGSGT